MFLNNLLIDKNNIECLKLFENYKNGFEYDFTNLKIIKLHNSVLIHDENNKHCIKGNTLNYKFNPIVKKFNLINVNWIGDNDSIIELVSNLKIVKEKIKRIESISKGKRHISLLAYNYNKSKNIYLVKVCEDIGWRYYTYFNFLVDANSMNIINSNGEINE